MEHTWTVEQVDGGPPIGLGNFWICSACHASGGPVWSATSPPTFHPFFADGSGLKVSMDCMEAKAQIQTQARATLDMTRRDDLAWKSARGQELSPQEKAQLAKDNRLLDILDGSLAPLPADVQEIMARTSKVRGEDNPETRKTGS